MATLQVVVLAVLRRDADGRFLLIRRSVASSGGGQIGFAGGKRESGETDREALVRETREELGLAVEVHDLVGTWAVDEWDVDVHAYHVTGDHGAVAPSVHEVDEVVRATPEEMLADPAALRSTRLIAAVLATNA